MDVRITTRHVDLSDAFMLQAEDRTRKLSKYEPRLLAVDLLFEEDHGSLATEANQFGAMPSLHIGWAVWCTLALWQLSSRTWVRGLAVLYPCLTAFAVLATGNHYLLDIVAGLATFALAVALVRVASVSHVTKLLLSRRTGRLAPASEDAL